MLSKSWRPTRLFLLAATLLAVAPAAASAQATLTVSPTSTSPVSTVTVSWAGVSPIYWDWIGLFVPRAPSTSRLDWFYAATCTQTIGGNPPANGSCTYTIPSAITPGGYELRYYGPGAGLQATAPLTLVADNIHEYVNGFPLYNSGSWVNTPLPANAPLDAASASMSAKFSSQVGVDANGSPISGDPPNRRWDGGVDVYVTQSTDASTWSSVCSTEVLTGKSWAWMNDLHSAWMTTRVPVPANMTAFDGGSDQGSTIYDPGVNQVWDFYQGPKPAPVGTVDPQGRACDFEAAGGDYDPNVSGSPGYFQTQVLAGGIHEDALWGRRASALPSAAGAITPAEWNNPTQGFDHALQLVVPYADQTKQYWPAERHDGGIAGIGGLPEGARVRIDPTATCPHPTAGTAGPTQLAYDRAYELCVTMQTYGAVVTDQSGSGAYFLFADVFGGKPDTITLDGPGINQGRGSYPFSWYWDQSLTHELPHLQVIDGGYRPPYTPAQ